MVDLNNIKLPFVLKDRKLFVSGYHNGEPFHLSDIKAAYELTNWNDKRITSVYLDHRDGITHDSYGNERVGIADVRDYAGSIKNIKIKNGALIGDVYIVDMPTAIKVAHDDSRFGISPFGGWKDGKPLIRNFAMVVNPAQGSETELGKNFAMSKRPSKFTLNNNSKMDYEDMKDEIGGMISPLKEEIVNINKELLALKSRDVTTKTPSSKDTRDKDDKSLDDKVKEILQARENEAKSKKELEELKSKVEALETEKANLEKIKQEMEDKINANDQPPEKVKDNKEDSKGDEQKDNIQEDVISKDTPELPKNLTENVNDSNEGDMPKVGIQKSNEGMVDFLQKLGNGI